MVVISCPGKFHAFSLAEQLSGHGLLEAFYTTYASQKNVWLRKFAGRIDKENIPRERILTYLPWAIKTKLRLSNNVNLNEEFDKWVSTKITGSDYRVFIGWASISLNCIREARKRGKTTIIERGSSHIQYQNNLLQEEYSKFQLNFKIDELTLKKEIREYEEVDFISIPSSFVKKSFLEFGIPESKLIVNSYGASLYFKPQTSEKFNHPFRILYVGSMSIRKGLIYLFQALSKLSIEYEAWFIGSMDEVIKPLFMKYKSANWKYWGPVHQYDLPGYMNRCDVAVQPSIEEGLSMVIPQFIGCGVPVIATCNTGGEDVIDEGKTGFIVPIRSSDEIYHKLTHLYNNPNVLQNMKNSCRTVGSKSHGWDDYGARYASFLKTLV